MLCRIAQSSRAQKLNPAASDESSSGLGGEFHSKLIICFILSVHCLTHIGLLIQNSLVLRGNANSIPLRLSTAIFSVSRVCVTSL